MTSNRDLPTNSSSPLGAIHYLVLDFDGLLVNQQVNRDSKNNDQGIHKNKRPVKDYIIPDNLKLLNFFITFFRKINADERIDTVIIGSGTARQHHINDVGQPLNHFSCISAYEIIAHYLKDQLNDDQIKVLHDVFRLSDLDFQNKRCQESSLCGVSYKERLICYKEHAAWYEDQNYFPNLFKMEREKNEHLHFPSDRHKILLLYLHIQRASLLHPSQPIHIHFVDDRKDILNNIKRFLEGNLNRLPENVTLSLYHCDDKEHPMTLVSCLHGTGKPDEQCSDFLRFIGGKRIFMTSEDWASAEKGPVGMWDQWRKAFDDLNTQTRNNLEETPREDPNCLSNTLRYPGEFANIVDPEIFKRWRTSCDEFIENGNITKECHSFELGKKCFSSLDPNNPAHQQIMKHYDKIINEINQINQKELKALQSNLARFTQTVEDKRMPLLNQQPPNSSSSLGAIHYLILDFDRLLVNRSVNRDLKKNGKRTTKDNQPIEASIIPDNLKLLNFFITFFRKISADQRIDTVIIGSGTNRQDHATDITQSSRFSCISVFPIIAHYFENQLREDQIKVLHDVFRLPDLDLENRYGESALCGASYKERLNCYQRNKPSYEDPIKFNRLESLAQKEKYLTFPFEENKIFLSYLHVQRASLLHPDQPIHIHFVDDRKDILNNIKRFLEGNLNHLPENVILSLYYCDDKEHPMTLVSCLHGTGEPDKQCGDFLRFIGTDTKIQFVLEKKSWAFKEGGREGEWVRWRKAFNDFNTQTRNNLEENPRKDPNCLSNTLHNAGKFFNTVNPKIFEHWCTPCDKFIENGNITKECHPLELGEKCFSSLSKENPVHQETMQKYDQIINEINHINQKELKALQNNLKQFINTVVDKRSQNTCCLWRSSFQKSPKADIANTLLDKLEVEELSQKKIEHAFKLFLKTSFMRRSSWWPWGATTSAALCLKLLNHHKGDYAHLLTLITNNPLSPPLTYRELAKWSSQKLNKEDQNEQTPLLTPSSHFFKSTDKTKFYDQTKQELQNIFSKTPCG